MKGGIMLIIGEDGKATVYDDTYDIVIHCESQEEQDRVKQLLENIQRRTPCSEELITFGAACKKAGVDEKDLKSFVQDCEFAWRVMQSEILSAIREAFEKYTDISAYQDDEEGEECIETQVGSLVFREKVLYGIKDKLKEAYMEGYTAAAREYRAGSGNDHAGS